MTDPKRIKRYYGRNYNVKTNIFFEDYMEDVAKETKNILAFLPSGFLSRSLASRKFGLSRKDFEADEVKSCAVIVTVRGQTGLFFQEAVIRNYMEENMVKIPPGWIPEQRIVRSFKARDKPEGFPLEFRKYSFYGQQTGRAGRPTYFYSEDDLEEYLQIKVIRAGEEIVPTSEVDFGVDAEPFFGLKLSPMYEKMDTYFFGELAEQIKKRTWVAQQDDTSDSDMLDRVELNKNMRKEGKSNDEVTNEPESEG